MKYGSVCSGIEAASVAWGSLGWKAQWYSEIEPFPSAVLAHRFPTVPNLGDMTEIHNQEDFYGKTIDILVGGTPCQSFSVAGLRKGLVDPRGNLMLTFLSLAERKKPRWIVWENVPGVLSSNGGRDFATFLTALAELGYGFAYRILDSQYFGVAQRRRRVFVVGYLGDWRPCASVLFEQDCLSGNTKKSREEAIELTRLNKDRANTTGIPMTAQTLSSRDHKGPSCGRDGLVGNPIVFKQNGIPRIRKLTLIESERLQGFPDNWTLIPYRNKSIEQCPDGPRYKACGNSMAVPVMRWIGQRIEMVEKLIADQ